MIYDDLGLLLITYTSPSLRLFMVVLKENIIDFGFIRILTMHRERNKHLRYQGLGHFKVNLALWDVTSGAVQT
jgi:hypothetical protein